MTEYRNIYRYWKVEEIRPHIIKYLKEKFPDSIIEREFNNVDIMVHGPNIPIEIQKTNLAVDGSPMITDFENSIRNQIEQNIEISGECWLFFDAKLLNFLQNSFNRSISLNMDWLFQFFKTGKLRLFIITIDGIIRELEDNDFEFIKRLSNTCKLNKDEEFRILQKNKSKIAYRVYRGHGFTTDDINGWYDEYEKNTEGLKFLQWLRIREGKRKELAVIKSALSNIMAINEMLKCESKDYSGVNHASYLRIIEGNGREKNSRIRCSDNDNILECFPGYFIKQELWDYWRTHTVNQRIFSATIKGEFDYLKNYKNQKSIEDAWSQ